MKNLIIFLLIVLTQISCKTKSYIKYQNRINEAEFAFFNEDYEAASNHYKNAFKKVRIPFEDDIYFYAVSLWQVGDKDESIKLLDTLIDTRFALTQSGYFENMNAELRDSILKRNDPIVDSIRKVRSNNPTKKILDSIFQLDISVRKTVLEYIKEYPNDTLGIDQQWENILIQDSLNLMVIDSLNFIGGVHFPSHPYIVGYLLIHQTEWVSQNKRKLNKAIKDGRLFPVYYACPIDYNLVKQGDTAVYYGQWSQLLDGVSPEEVFKRSIKLGISPYYNKYIRIPKKKGLKPKEHLYFEYYRQHKEQFDCY